MDDALMPAQILVLFTKTGFLFFSQVTCDKYFFTHVHLLVKRIVLRIGVVCFFYRKLQLLFIFSLIFLSKLYYILTFKSIIWYNTLIVYIHFILHCTYIFKYKSHLNPHFNQPIPPNLSQILPVSHLNSSKSVWQYNMNISTLYLFFDVSK